MRLSLASFVQDPDFIRVLYIVAFVLFILGMRELTSPTTARRGNRIAGAGMAIAVVATLLFEEVGDYGLIALGIALGTVIGVPAARQVKMTAMPQMVALFNGVGGGAVALISWAEYREALNLGGNPELDTLIPILFAATIGSISFWGSNIAFAKLQGVIAGKPVAIPGQQFLNLALLLVAVGAAVAIAAGAESEGLFILILVAAAVLGNTVVLPIGGADMPVVISLLNALTGLSAAAAGIALNNVALIVAGIIVGASGTILTNLMATAMNRSIPSIVAGGFGGGAAVSSGGDDDGEERPHRSTDATSVALALSLADRVVVAPGYGLAVAQAQHTVRELADELEKRGVEVNYAIHPVAGRMPGHMNVLLAEADVPYEALKEMDEINPEFETTDVTLVIGANDVTNPAAREDEGSPIYGMPILDVDKSQSVVVLKRSMSAGFAGIDNPLFYNENTELLFGDAKSSVNDVLAAVKNL